VTSSPAGISCPPSCTMTASGGDVVTLTPHASHLYNGTSRAPGVAPSVAQEPPRVN
jgi:hypothetical protein